MRLRNRLLVTNTGRGALAPNLTLPGSPSAWYTAYDTSFMTVNSDGTGGAPASGAKFGRFVDRTGGGLHATQATGANQLYAQSGWASVYNVASSGLRGFMQTASAPAGGTQSVTGLIIVDAVQFPADMIPFTFVSGAEQTAAWPCNKVALAFRGSATALEFWINGVQYSRAAISSVALSVLNIGADATTFTQHRRFYEYAIYSTALNDTDFAALRAYGAARTGSASVSNDAIVYSGDSRTFGTNTIASSPPVRVSTRLANYRRYNNGIGGTTAQIQRGNMSATIQKFKGAGRNVAVVMYGTNDFSAGRTPAQVEADVAAICLSYRNSGYRVVVCSEIYRTTTVSNATIDSYNTLLAANWTNYADAYANLLSRSELTNPADTTYYADGLHLTDAGNAVIAEVQDAAINAIDADFAQSALSVVAGSSITFTDQTINGPTAWQWNVDGGGVDSTAQNPTIVFNTPGTFSPVLTATNANGSTSRAKSSNIIVVSSLLMPTSNLVLFFDKGNASGATWTDTSGLARDMTLFNSPTITGGVVTFNGTTQYGKTAAYAANRPVVILVRLRMVSWSSGRYIIDGDTTASWTFYQTGVTPSVSFFNGGGPFAANASLAVGAWGTAAFGNALNGLQVFTDLNARSESYATVTSGATGLTVARQGGAASGFANVEIAAIAGFSVVPSDAVLAQARAYMTSL